MLSDFEYFCSTLTLDNWFHCSTPSELEKEILAFELNCVLQFVPFASYLVTGTTQKCLVVCFCLSFSWDGILSFRESGTVLDFGSRRKKN